MAAQKIFKKEFNPPEEGGVGDRHKTGYNRGRP
jgi:hypothetical protein